MFLSVFLQALNNLWQWGDFVTFLFYHEFDLSKNMLARARDHKIAYYFKDMGKSNQVSLYHGQFPPKFVTIDTVWLATVEMRVTWVRSNFNMYSTFFVAAFYVILCCTDHVTGPPFETDSIIYVEIVPWFSQSNMIQ